MKADYIQKLISLIVFIDNNLEENLTLTVIAKQADLSKYHLHRLFSSFLGITPFQYIENQRLKRASYLLAFRKEFSITDIAFLSAVENVETFSRKFKTKFCTSPSQFRHSPDWAQWCQSLANTLPVKELSMSQKRQTLQVKLVDFQQVKVAAIEHLGDPNLVLRTIAKFIEWRKLVKLSPAISDTYNILYHAPESVLPDEYRMDICASIQGAVEKNTYGIVEKEISAGRCAVFRHEGSDDTLRTSFDYLYSHWLPQSGEVLRDSPIFLHRVNLFPDVKEHEMIIDIYLPIV